MPEKDHLPPLDEAIALARAAKRPWLSQKSRELFALLPEVHGPGAPRIEMTPEILAAIQAVIDEQAGA